MANPLPQLKRHWIGGKVTGESSQMSLDDLTRKYYIEQLSTVSPNEKPEQLEKRWLRKWITDNGGTPIASKYLNDLWKQAVVVLGKSPSSRRLQNQQTFYLNAA